MLTRLLLLAVCLVVVIAAIAIPLRLAGKTPISTSALSGLTTILLWIAGAFSGFTALIALAAAAWGMDTRPPWGLGVYMYLIPALSLPAFLLLLFSTVRTLSRFLWALTILNPFAWYFGDRADRIASGMRPISDPMEIFGMFINAFTILLVMISVMVQLADICKRREERESRKLASPDESP